MVSQESKDTGLQRILLLPLHPNTHIFQGNRCCSNKQVLAIEVGGKTVTRVSELRRALNVFQGNGIWEGCLDKEEAEEDPAREPQAWGVECSGQPAACLAEHLAPREMGMMR